jgi:predicted DNA-binding protein
VFKRYLTIQGESMSLSIHATPYTQYPLRLDQTLHERFTQISSSTRIPKSTLGRIGITKLLNEIDEKGITQVLNEIQSS